MDFRFKKLLWKYRIHIPRFNTWEPHRTVMSNLIKAIQCSYHANLWLGTIFLESMKFIKSKEKNVININIYCSYLSSLWPLITEHALELIMCQEFHFLWLNSFWVLLLCLTSDSCPLPPVRVTFQHHFESTCCSFLLSILKGEHFLTNKSFKEYFQSLKPVCSQLPPSAAIPWIEWPLSLHSEFHMPRGHLLFTPFPEIAK